MVDRYAEALEELERLRAAGQVSQATYDVQRAKLLAEATAPKRSRATTVVLFIVSVAVLFVLLRVVMALVG